MYPVPRVYSLRSIKCGLPVVTAPSNGTESITVHVFVGAGSRYETRAERGISHFLEHMFFKGGSKYKNSAEVSMAIDAYGGAFNAFTGKEYAGYYVKIAASHIDTACDVLSDMLLHATLPQGDVEKESDVIIEELRMYRDTPMYQAGWDFEELLYGNQQLGWDTIGTEKTIRAVTHESLASHKEMFYTPDNMVLVFSGNIDEPRALELGEKFFGDLAGSRQREFPALSGRGENQIYLTTKKTEQSHLVLGVEAESALSKHHFEQSILATIIGGNMSSRMFLNIREARGLCYYISSSTDSYLDTGYISIRAGVDKSRLDEAIISIKNELLSVAKDGITEGELSRAKEFLKGKLVLSLEDSEERAHFYGRQQLLYADTDRGVLDIEDYFREIDSVAKKNVDDLAKQLFRPKRFRLVVIGDRKDEAALKTLLEQ